MRSVTALMAPSVPSPNCAAANPGMLVIQRMNLARCINKPDSKRLIRQRALLHTTAVRAGRDRARQRLRGNHPGEAWSIRFMAVSTS